MTYDDYAALRAQVVTAYVQADSVEKIFDGKKVELKDNAEASRKFGDLLRALAPLSAERDPDENQLVKDLFAQMSVHDGDACGRKLFEYHPAVFPVWIVQTLLSVDRVSLDTSLTDGAWETFAHHYEESILQA